MKMFKKIMCIVLVVIMCLTVVPFNGILDLGSWMGNVASAINDLSATGQCGDNIYWNFNNVTGELIISGSGAMYDYAVDTSPFYQKSTILKVTIEEGVTTVGACSFSGCEKLASVNLPASITAINSNAFMNCSALTNIDLPVGITAIQENTFVYCSSLESIVIPEGVTSIKDQAFMYCSNLSGVILPNSLTDIGGGAFYDCNKLTDIVVPYNATNWGSAAFSQTAITDIYIPNRVEAIGDYMFNGCDSLEKVTIPVTVTAINYSAFGSCDKLTDVYYEGSQEDWEKITTDSGNDSLNNATVHYNSEMIQTETLYSYRTKTRLTSSNPEEEGYIYEGSGWSEEPTKTQTVKYAKTWPSGSSTTKGFKTDSSIYKQYNKPSVSETDTIKTVLGDESKAKTVGYLYWHWCYTHTDIDDGPINCVIKDNKAGKVEKYNANGQATGTYYTTSNFHAFDTTSALSFNSSAKAYKKSYSDECKYTYWWSGLNFGKSGNIEIISNTLSTYEKEYYHYKWSEWSEWSNVPVEETSDIEVKIMVVEKPLKSGKCGEDVNYILDKNGTLTISGTGPMYNYIWDDFEATGMPPYMTWENEDFDGEMWIVGDKTIKNVVIEPGVTTIGDYAFNTCTALENVEIADTVTSIGETSFDYCISLKNISIPSSVKVIKEEAFSESGLETIEIENGLETVEQIAFLYCQNLKTVILPESVTRIGDYAFILCDKLETLVINNKDCEIGQEILLTAELDEGGYPVEDENGYEIFDSRWLVTECPTTLKGHSGSTAEMFAQLMTENGYPIKFEVINHKYVEINTVSATCTERGYTLFECSECGSEKEDNIIAPLGHNYTEKIMDAAHLVSTATYEKGSVYKFDCSRCESVGEETFECDDKLVAVTGVTLNKTSITLKKGDSQTLTATVKPDNAADKKVKWSSSNTSVATVDSGGKVKAVGKGTATITAKNERSSKSATCNVTVTVPVTGVSLNKTSVSVAKGQTYQLKATIKPGDANNKNVNWSSSNTNVATVNSSGKVTAKAVGTATITVKTKDGGKTATCKVTVTSGTINVLGVSLDKNSASVFVGKSIILNASIKPVNATNKKMTWSSSDTAVATVDNSGKVIGKAKGTATITVKTTDGNKIAKCTITVNPYNENIKKIGQFIVGAKNYKQSVTFDANWLSESSYKYNHELAKFCSLASLLMYENTYAGRISSILESLKSIGFETKEKGLSYYVPARDKTQEHKNSYIITKKDYVIDGENETVILVMLRGTNGNEWYGNFVPGKDSSTHYSFNNGKNDVLAALKKFINNNELTDNIKLLITGHSRGAAVGNLLSADIIKNNKFTEPENIFTYTFATPNVTKLSERKNSMYSNIFNFVNPEDFVTKCMPYKWGYGRYGITLTLPSKTNEKKENYKKYYDNMNSIYKKYTGEAYTHYAAGEIEVYNVSKSLTDNVSNVKKYYSEKLSLFWPFTSLTAKEFFIQTLCPFVSDTASFGDYLEALLNCAEVISGVSNAAYDDLLAFFITAEVSGMILGDLNDLANKITKGYVNAVDRKFAEAHCAETYSSFVTSMNYNQAYTWAKDEYRKPHKNTVNCPVDIEVYDKDTDELVGRIVDNVVDEEVTSIVMYVEGDSKSFWLPSNGNYDVKLIGNDSGEMDYTVSAIDSDLGEVERINFLDVPVEEGFEYVGEFTQEDFSIDEYTLTTELGDTVEKTEKLTEEEFNTLDISVNIEGLGYVKGEGVYTSGDYIVLEAVTDENNEFIGWYEEDELICKEATLAFVVQENKTFKAKFTDVYVEATGLSLSESEITLDDSDENSYAILEAILTPANATDMGFEWSTSDESVATVSEFGFVRAVGCGNAIITVSTADGKFSGRCTVTVDCLNHNMSEETIESDATCAQSGYGYNTCKLCGHRENFTIEKYDHIYESRTVDASCTGNGYVINECISCEYSYKSEITPMVPHSFDEWTVITAALCETSGLEQRDCIGCSHHEVNEIPAKGHSFDGDICTECGESRAADCSCNCHKSGIVRLFFKIILFFQRIFKSNKECKCGIYHY